MIAAVIALLGLLTASWVLLPLARRTGGAVTIPGPDTDLEALLDRRDEAYNALGELEFDRELGKLNEADYNRLYTRYRKQAVSALVAADEREGILGERAERAIREARQARNAPTGVAPAGQAVPRQQRSSRRGALWAGIASLLFAALAAGTLVVYLQGSTREATAVGTLPSDGVSALLVDATAEGTLWAGDTLGLLRSADGGRTWGRPGLSGDIRALAQRSGTLYALVNGELQRSANGGLAWQPVATGKRPIIALAAGVGGLYAVDSDGALLTSEDGAKWRAGTRTNRKPHALAVDASAPPVIYGADADGVLALRGGSWSPANGFVNGALPTDVVPALLFDPSTGEVADLPGGGRLQGTLYAATDGGLFKTVDGGGSWIRLGLERDLRAVATGAPGSKLMVATDAEGKVYRSMDRGVTWNGK